MSERNLTVNATFDVGSARFGVEVSPIYIDDQLYMKRWILYIGGATLRLHRFYRGDDDRAPHTHPWAFWTFPLTDYWEHVWDSDNGRYIGRSVVKAWKLHARPANYRHIVEGRADRKTGPFWTFCVTGRYQGSWGFYPTPDKFVPWREWH